MSLINRMLQDLDARRPELGVRSKLPNDVRSLPKPRTSLLPWLVAGVLVVAAAAGFAVYRLDAWPPALSPARFIASPPVAMTPATTAVAAAPAATAPAAQATPQTLPAVQTELSVAEPVSSAVEASPAFDGGLRLDDTISSETQKNVGARPVIPAGSAAGVSPARAASLDKAIRADKLAAMQREKAEAPERPASPGPTTQGVAKSAKAPQIEKTESVGAPRERAETEYRKAIAVVNQGRVSEALEGLRKALQYDSLHSAARQLLVKLLLEAGQNDEAIQTLHAGLQGQPAQIGWAMSLARLQLERGDLAAAWQTLDASLPAAGGSADYQGFAAHVLQRLGRNREAADYYLAATRLSPGEGRWWLGLGLALEAEGRSAEARDAFLRAKASGTLAAALTSLIDQKLR